MNTPRQPTPALPPNGRPGYGAFILLTLLAANLLALLAQMVLGFDSTNLASACIVFASSVSMLLYLLWTPALQTHPLSTFALLGFCVTTQMGALLGQSAFGVPIADRLRQPVETFAWLAAFQTVALAMHAAYRWVGGAAQATRPSAPRRLLDTLGLYTPPPTAALWFMGYIGLFAILLGSGREGVFAKTLQGMAFLTWAPFLIPMYVLQWGTAYCRWQRQAVHLVFFAMLVVLLGLAANSRSMILSGFMTVMLFALLILLRSRSPVRWARVAQSLAALAVLVAVAIPVSDLATAMVVARKARGSISAIDMVKETWRAYGDPDTLEADRQMRAAAASARYDEHYFDNVLLARLVETKFHDNSLYFVSTFTQSDREQLFDATVDLFIVVLPTPLIDRLGLGVDKRDYQFSMGDYLAHLGQGGPLGGYRTGSMVAHGLGLMGPGYLALYAALCVLAFLFLDLLSARRTNGTVLVSAVGMLMLWDLFLGGVTGESVHGWMTTYLRTLPQTIAIFLIVAGVARAVGWLFSGLTPRPRATSARPPPHPALG